MRSLAWGDGEVGLDAGSAWGAGVHGVGRDEPDDGRGASLRHARDSLRLLIAKLGAMVRTPSSRGGVGHLVEAVLTLRGELRRQGRYDLADALRAALLNGGVLVEDTPDGPRWTSTATR
ncbi:hypothetical protein [Streptosporangium sp. CA-115845]|uniref:hypothetical protein n=1 Tax=Streptosporangium sp. CA-115845 TaxID=3240071 RepID=UPI003D8D2DC4